VSADKFFDQIGLLRCPACGTAFSRCQNALRCENGHTFDVSRKGYVHFAPNVSPSRYDEPLFAARRRILEAGFYDAVIAAIRSAIPEGACAVLDAGCGDGTFTKALARETTIGLDLSKDAILLAARGGGPILWTVGDLTKLPLSDASVDVILNLFSPAHYAEFARVLKPNGTLLKLVPQTGYLKEIRALMGDRLKRESYANDAVVSHLSERFKLLDRRRVTNTFPLSETQAGDFLRMTPLTFGINADELDVSKLTEITIDVELLLAQK
jgi:23S rRNA (guanine745-N1)-methyltransferase